LLGYEEASLRQALGLFGIGLGLPGDNRPLFLVLSFLLLSFNL
jgi:hypothetical protein